MTAMRIIFGCGYRGHRVAKLWRQAGAHTVAFSRNDDPTPGMIEAEVLASQADVTKPESLRCLSQLPAPSGIPAEALLFAVGYDATAGPDINTVYASGLRNVLAALPASVTRVVYISTTGVYGPAGGEFVGEQTAPDPQRDGGKASLAAEEVLRGHALAGRSVVLRLAGIYGPGRIPYLDKLRAGEPIAAPSAGWLNLIHVDDAARVVVAADAWLAARQASDGPHVFNVSDGKPVIRGDYYAEVARLLGAPPPVFIAPPTDSPAALRASANRRIDNEKMLREFRVRLSYPSYREGLAAILNSSADY
jgi:nucleoside-diphosphate-sugar epimerase